jgi:glutamate-5-semialdehyde dehydrogenase
MTRALVEIGLDPKAIQLVPTRDREAVGHMLSGMDGAIDLIIPRGGKSLVKRVHDEARIAVLAHLDGVNHVYVDRNADPEMAVRITLNAKMRRVSVCGAAETLLIDRAASESLRRRLILELLQSGCAVRGDSAIQQIDPCVSPATVEDWSTEYLDAVMSVKLVDGIDDAIKHIDAYGSRHTDAIITNNEKTAERFLQMVDSAIVLWNASTQFADGSEFGLGAEIGIATGRLHARGPVGADQLTTYKYVVRGHGQTRP